MTETHDFRADAEEAILSWFRNRAEARGFPGPGRVRRAFADISPTGAVSYYVYRATGVPGEKIYLAHDAAAYCGGNTIYNERPSFFPRTGRARLAWEDVR